jgi:hypothetical protein
MNTVVATLAVILLLWLAALAIANLVVIGVLHLLDRVMRG